MKIALIADTFSVETGTGIARYANELLIGLKKKGIDVKPVCVKPLNIPFGSVIDHSFRLPYHILSKIDKFDLIHATSPSVALSFAFIKKPKVLTYHDLTSILYRNSGVAFHTKMSTPIIYKLIGKYCDKSIAVSTQTKNEIIKYLNIPERKISVINLGINEKFTQIKINKNSNYIIGYIGSLMKRKRVDFLIKSFYHFKSSYPELKAKLFIYGDKKFEYFKLLELAKRLGINNDIIFFGKVAEEDIIEIFNSFDAFVMPSKWEGFSLPILEAQKCGIPVIIKNDAHIPDEVKKYVIETSSEEDMAEKIYMLYTDVYLRNDIIKKGVEYSKRFTWNKTVEETIKVYNEVIDNE